MIDETHDPARESWVASAAGHPEFPLQNLPLCLFAPPGEGFRPGVAIGEEILDLLRLQQSGGLEGAGGEALDLLCNEGFNAFFAAGSAARRALRQALFARLDRSARPLPELLHPTEKVGFAVPAVIGDYTDFFAGIHHATNTGRQFRPDNPLLPNYKYIPVAYHGRASSVVVSGTPVRRPSGQRKPAHEPLPTFGPSRNLDFELELGIWIGPGNPLGTPIPIIEAGEHVAGFCLLNDWSARDIQAFEYQPLGPFLAKSFATSISPFIVTPEALAPFRIPQPPRPEGDPAPLPHLFDRRDQAEGAFDITLEVYFTTDFMRERGLAPCRISLSTTRHLYWTVGQMIAHHTSNGCNLRPGDLFGSGTISGPEPGSFGSLLEITAGGRQPLSLPSGESRRFLEDGDEVILRAVAQREGFRSIGFGACQGRILPAL
jgi:fumarylacetoacetase